MNESRYKLKKINSPMEPGYVFAPYIMATTTEIFDPYYTNKKLLEERKEKIKKILKK